MTLRGVGGLSIVLCQLLACSSDSDEQTSPEDCPSVLQEFDAGTDASLPGTEWSTGTVCDKLCPPSYPVCRLETESAIRCMKACN
jgi:hypothetical protein